MISMYSIETIGFLGFGLGVLMGFIFGFIICLVSARTKP